MTFLALFTPSHGYTTLKRDGHTTDADADQKLRRRERTKKKKSQATEVAIEDFDTRSNTERFSLVKYGSVTRSYVLSVVVDSYKIQRVTRVFSIDDKIDLVDTGIRTPRGISRRQEALSRRCPSFTQRREGVFRHISDPR